MDSAQPEKRTAFVLAGGGSFGAVQVGMLRALMAHEVRADFVVGASVGAINGAYFAGRPDAAGVASLVTIWEGLSRRDVFPVTWRSLLGMLRGAGGLVGPEGVRRLLESHLPYRNLEDAAIPMYVVATNVLSGELEVFSKGPAIPAIIASAAIPAAFAPVWHDLKYLVDGALTSNTPVKVAMTEGAERIIVLPTGYACALMRPPQGPVASALHAVSLLIARQLAHEVESIKEKVELRIVPPLCPLTGSAYDFSQSRLLMQRATEVAEQWISSGGLSQYDMPGALKAHSHLHDAEANQPART
jgi:NTE family protein